MPPPRKSSSKAKPSNYTQPNEQDDNSNDPVIQEFPLIFQDPGDSINSEFNLLYFPLSVPDAGNSIPSFDQDCSTLQVKPESRQLQITYGHRKYWGTAPERLHTQEYVAVVHQGQIYLKPVHRVYTMRPQVSPFTMDTTDNDKDNAEAEETAAAAKPVTIIKKRETEEQALARLSSYIYLRKKAEEEPWKVMRLVKKSR